MEVEGYSLGGQGAAEQLQLDVEGAGDAGAEGGGHTVFENRPGVGQGGGRAGVRGVGAGVGVDSSSMMPHTRSSAIVATSAKLLDCCE